MSSWTIDSLKEYMDSRFEAIERNTKQSFEIRDDAHALEGEASRTAISKSETAVTKRFEGVNEFRNALLDQQNTFIPRREVEVLVETINARLNRVQEEVGRVRESVSESVGRRVVASEYIAYFITILAVIATVVAVYFK